MLIRRSWAKGALWSATALGAAGLPALGATPAAATAATELIAYTEVDTTAFTAQARAISPNGGSSAPISTGPADSILPMYSPDGDRVAFIKGDLSTGDGALWVAAADGSGAQQVTQLTAPPFVTLDALSGWSPDGKLLAFTRTYDTIPGDDQPEVSTGRVSQVWVVDVASRVETQIDPSDTVRFGASGAYLSSGVFSPDSAQVVFHTSEPDPPFALGDVYRAPVAGGGSVRVTNFAVDDATAQNPVFSPDGSRIAFTGAEDLPAPACGLYSVPASTVDAPAGTTSPVAELDCPGGGNPYLPQPYYSPNGATIAIASADEGDPIRTVAATGGTFTPVTTSGATAIESSPVWSPDSTRLVYTHQEELPSGAVASLRIVRVSDPAHSEITLVQGIAIATSWRAGSPPPVAAGNPCIVGTPAPAGYNLIEGTKGDNRLVGTPGKDLIRGNGGKDRIFGKAGEDILCGNAGADRIVGGKGVDLIRGGDGPDVLFGGRGGDSIFGERGNDFLLGGSGADSLNAGRGRDQLSGGAGRDHLDGGRNFDVAVGGPAKDGFDRVEDRTQ